MGWPWWQWRGPLARCFSCVRAPCPAPSRRHVLPDSATRLLLLATASSHPASLSKGAGRCSASPVPALHPAPCAGGAPLSLGLVPELAVPAVRQPVTARGKCRSPPSLVLTNKLFIGVT